VAKVNPILYTNISARSVRLHQAAEIQEAYTLCISGTPPRVEAIQANLSVRRLIQAYYQFQRLGKSSASEELLEIIEMAVIGFQVVIIFCEPTVKALQLFSTIDTCGV